MWFKLEKFKINVIYLWVFLLVIYKCWEFWMDLLGFLYLYLDLICNIVIIIEDFGGKRFVSYFRKRNLKFDKIWMKDYLFIYL